MKKYLITLGAVLLAVFASATLACAADTTGFYNVDTASNVTISPYAGETLVSATNRDVDGDSEADVLYVGSDRLEVTLDVASNEGYYGVLLVEDTGSVPTRDSEIYYIDQVSPKNNQVKFNVYPILPEETTDLTLYLSSSVAGAELISIDLSYLVSKPAENDVRVSTINGAQIRTSGVQGLRFISSIDKTSVDFSRVVEYGTVLIPSADITDISELQIGATLNGHAVAKVKANFRYDETDDAVTFTAVITNVAEKNYAREYTARAYAILDDGSVVYAESGASRSIYAVAKRGLDNPSESDENKEIFQKIVDIVEG